MTGAHARFKQLALAQEKALREGHRADALFSGVKLRKDAKARAVILRQLRERCTSDWEAIGYGAQLAIDWGEDVVTPRAVREWAVCLGSALEQRGLRKE